MRDFSNKKKGISMGEILTYSMGLLGLQCVIGYMNSYQAQFYNKTMAADMAIIGIIMLAAKLISSFADPIIGSLIDRSNIKSGKLRPWIAISILPFFMLSILIFIVVPFRGVGLYCYIFVTFLLWSISMSLADIPSQGMLAMLTPNPVERNKIAGIANFLKGVGPSLPYVIVPLVCIISKSEGGAIGQREYLISAVLIAVLGCSLFSLIFFKNRERVPYTSNKSSMKDMIVMLKGNKPLFLLLLSAFIGFTRSMGLVVQTQAAHSLIGDINLFGIAIGGENTIIILGVTSAISVALSMIIMPALTKKIGEKKVFIGMAIYGFIIATFTYLIYVLGIRSLASILIMLFFVGIMYGPNTFLPLIMVADCVDYYEWKTGKRTEGAHFAVLSFSIKVPMALTVAVGLIMVGLSGYSANATSFSVQTQNIIYAAFVLLPGIGCLLSAIPIFFYKLVGNEKKKIILELAERRAAAGESAGSEVLEAIEEMSADDDTISTNGKND
ncbi:MAG: MFS transporter [Clostridia bacterium]|nr:MFS transporter [Clostridia bacterium]